MTLIPFSVPGIGQGRWNIGWIHCRAGESAHLNAETCDEKGHIALFTGMGY